MINTNEKKADRVNPFLNLKSIKREDIIAAIWVVLSFAFVLFMMKTGRVNYETNDDVVMAQITSGVFKEYSSYNVFNNIILGFLLSVFTRFFSGHNWQTLMDLGFIALSYAMIGVLCIKTTKKHTLISLIIPVTFVLATFRTLILGINFSKVGALTFLVGFLTILYTLDKEMLTKDAPIKKIPGLRVVGYIMLIAGSLIRLDSVKAMLPFMAILICYYIFKYKADFKLEKGRINFSSVIGKINTSGLFKIIIPLFIVLIFWVANFCVYNTKEWKDYNRYEKTCVDIQDFYNFPGYSDHAKEYDSIGLNEHDVVMFSCYVHADDEVFSLKTIESIRDMAKKDAKKPINYDYIKQIIKRVLSMLGTETIILAVVLLFVVAAFVTPKWLFVFNTAAVALMFAELSYLSHINRVLERSLILPIIGAFLVIIYLLLNNIDGAGIVDNSVNANTFESKSPILAVMLFFIMVYAFFTRGMCDISSIQPYVTPDKENLEALNNELKEQPENLYIWDYQSYVDASMQYASPLDAYPFNFMGNSLVLGAWPVEMPLMREIAEPFGNPGNLIRIVVENPNAYYVFEQTNPYMTIGAMEEYIRDHYDPEAGFAEVKTIGNYTIYQVETMDN